MLTIPYRQRRLVVGFALFLCACSSLPQRYAADATAFGFASTLLQGTQFRHVAYFADADVIADTLHVYVEHDGTPWIDGTRVAMDPTPRTPIALTLMARDRSPRLLLGRPCYFGLSTDPGCGPLFWTHRRYAPEVVESMATALRAFLAKHSYPHVVLIGYSGGGTLAWLMASRIKETTAVVTIASDLDIDAWTTLHAYSPMAGSLNPANEGPLSARVRHVAYFGGRDDNVPLSTVRSFLARHPETTVVEIPEFDHECCWVERWPRLLGGAETRSRDTFRRDVSHRQRPSNDPMPDPKNGRANREG